MKDRMTLNQQASKILEEAEKSGVKTNYFFKTTFKRYKMQMKILRDLEKSIKEHGALVTKEYVKGRENLVSNPAITEYNRTSTAANGTVATLLNILKSLTEEERADSKLKSLIQSLDESE